jgi:hypothetical protein
MSQGFTKGVPIDTDATLSANSNLLVPSQYAVRTYVTAQIAAGSGGGVPTTRSISTTSPLSGGGDLTADRTLAINQATTSADGYLSSTNWNTFNGKTTSPWAFRISGRFYTPSTNALAIGSLLNAADIIRFSPVIIERDITITQLGISVVTAAATGNTARVGIYTNNASTNQPLNRLIDSNPIAVDGLANSQRIVTGLSVTLTKGLYWFAYFTNASTGSVGAIANLNLPDVSGTTGITPRTLNNGIITGYNQSLTYTSLPATTGTLVPQTSQASSVCIFYLY